MLREVVEVLPAEQAGSVHFIAIGGAGMSGVAEIYHELGIPVSGCDRADSPALRHLADAGIGTAIGHDPAHLVDIDTVVVSSAIRDSNPEVIAAKTAGLRLWHRSAALAALMIGRRGVSVAGTHGKTTTSAMAAMMLSHGGIDPSYVIGSPLAASGRSAHLGGGDVLVIEADESDGSFLQYPTEIGVITNIEADHLDNWGTPQAYFEGFRNFAHGPTMRCVVINVDDPGSRQLAAELREAGVVKVVSYGEAADADYRLSRMQFENTSSSAQLQTDDGSYRLELQVPGRFNLVNATAAFAVGRLLGVEADLLLAAAREFTGTLRRFQLVASQPLTSEPGALPVRIYDDYAHHPTELRASLAAAARARGNGRLVACFQPHLFSRTRDFADEFGEALCLADLVVVTDVYAAREEPLPGVSGALIADAVQAHAGPGLEVHYVPDKADLPSVLADLVRAGDLVMTLGAGDVTLVGPMLAGQLEKRVNQG